MFQPRALRSGRIVPYVDRTGKPLPPSDLSSLCYRDASVKLDNNEITEDEYLQALVRHCDGIRHGTNLLCNNDELPKPGFVRSGVADNVPRADRFTLSIAHWISKSACKKNTRTIDNTTPIFEVLRAYRSNDVAAFNAGISEMDRVYEALKDPESLSILLCRTLADLIVGGREKKIEILKITLEKCHGDMADMAMDFEMGYQSIRKDKSNPDLLRVIDASGFKPLVPRGVPRRMVSERLAQLIMFG